MPKYRDKRPKSKELDTSLAQIFKDLQGLQRLQAMQATLIHQILKSIDDLVDPSGDGHRESPRVD
ncbi:MAG: hypothetical protein R3C01_04030 [Planctomycetaceae bacterium]